MDASHLRAWCKQDQWLRLALQVQFGLAMIAFLLGKLGYVSARKHDLVIGSDGSVRPLLIELPGFSFAASSRPEVVPAGGTPHLGAQPLPLTWEAEETVIDDGFFTRMALLRQPHGCTSHRTRGSR
jgi:hypothetical protein